MSDCDPGYCQYESMKAQLDAKDALIRAGERVIEARVKYDDDYGEGDGLTENSEALWHVYEEAQAAYQSLRKQ